MRRRYDRNAYKPFAIDDYGKLRKKILPHIHGDTTYKTKRKLQEAADEWKEKLPEGGGGGGGGGSNDDDDVGGSNGGGGRRG